MAGNSRSSCFSLWFHFLGSSSLLVWLSDSLAEGLYDSLESLRWRSKLVGDGLGNTDGSRRNPGNHLESEQPPDWLMSYLS